MGDMKRERRRLAAAASGGGGGGGGVGLGRLLGCGVALMAQRLRQRDAVDLPLGPVLFLSNFTTT